MTSVISFDLWQTLITSNAAASNKTRRAQMLHDLLAPHISVEEFVTAFKESERLANKRCEQEPAHLGPKERLALVTSGFGLRKLTDGEFAAFYREQARNFQQFPPRIIRPDTLEVLKALSRRYVLAIISNTGFMNGAEMRPVLKAAGLLDFFEVQIFSDEVGTNKPHPAIFEELLRQADCAPEEALHLGDNRVADYEGARAAGLQAIHTPDPDAPLGAILGAYL